MSESFQNVPELCSFPCGGEERHKFSEADSDQLRISVLKGVGETEEAIIYFKLFWFLPSLVSVIRTRNLNILWNNSVE